MLSSMQGKFQQMSNQIIGRSQFPLPSTRPPTTRRSSASPLLVRSLPAGRLFSVDEMAGRIDELERSIEDLLQQTAAANPSAPPPAVDPKDAIDSSS